jgi:hypothetical protein
MGDVAKLSASANMALIEQLKELHVRGVLMQIAERGQLLDLKCEMPKCFCTRGRKAFDPKTHPPTDWAPSADHYPIPKALGGELRPWNVRVGHVLCNRVDYGWRTRVITLLKRDDMSLDEIAAELNTKRVQAPHGTNRWTAASVRKALSS